MFENDTVRSWKDPDTPIPFTHPSGDIDLREPVGGLLPDQLQPLVDWALSWLLNCRPDSPTM